MIFFQKIKDIRDDQIRVKKQKYVGKIEHQTFRILFVFVLK